MRRVQLSAFALVPLLALTGCPPVGDLPDTVEVFFSAAERQEAARDSGPSGLANSSWRVIRKAGADESEPSSVPPGPYGGLLNGGILQRPPAGEQIFIIDLGADGEMTRARENQYFLADIYGRDVPIGDDWSPTVLPLTSFRSASYGVQIGDRIGLAVEVQVRFGGAYVGRAVLYTWGTLNGDRIDGVFGYLLDFEGGLGAALLMSGGDQYDIFAERVE